MNKLFLLLTGIILVFLFSYKEKEKVFSFSDYIKADVKRIPELLNIADSLKKLQQRTPKYKIDETIRAKMRDRMRMRVDDENPPKAIISTQDMMDIISSFPSHNDAEDSLIFYFGTIRDQDDVNRYNKKLRTGEAQYQIRDLINRPTLLIALQSSDAASSEESAPGPSINHIKEASRAALSGLYDPAKICPPPLSCAK